MKLSLCMIVRDNEHTIRPCIESIRPWVDEMVVVDTGSKDQTPDILQTYGAKISYFEWIDDFSAARNESVNLANGEWIFWMDSDDTITSECGKKLRKLADSVHVENTMGYVMQVRCPGSQDNGLAEYTVVDHVKLFRNRPDLRFEGRIHEQVLMPIRAIGGEVVWTDIWVEHTGSELGEESQRKKVERDLRILHKDLEDRPGHPFVLFNFAMTHAEMGEYEEALKWVERCLDVSHLEESHVRKAFAYQVNCLFQTDRCDEALLVCKQARQHYPDDVELLFREAMILHSVGHYSASIERYREILSLPPTEIFRSSDPGISGFKCRFNLGLAYGDAKQLDMSELQFRQVLSDVPSYRPAIKAFGNMLIETGRVTTAEVEAEDLISNPDSNIDGQLLLARVQATRGDKAAATKTFADCQRQYPNDKLVLEECCKFHFLNENWLEAKQFLTSLIELDKSNAAALHNLGAVLLRLDERESAIEAFTKSLELRPNSVSTRQFLESAKQNKEPSYDV